MDLDVSQMVMVRPSSIHGYGVFALIDIPKATVIPNLTKKCLPEGMRRFCGYNHSCDYNLGKPGGLSVVLGSPKDIPFESLRDILAGEEITVNYYLMNLAHCRCPICCSLRAYGEIVS